MKRIGLLMILIFSAAILVSATVAEAANGQTMVAPVHGKINLKFGVPNPFDGKKPHTGIDIGASRGTVIRAPSTGKVEATGWGSLGEGNYIVISHIPGDYNRRGGYSPKETWTKYYHLNRIYVWPGLWVHQGQPIGTVGATGNASGYHLHFEIHENGRYGPLVNPQYYINCLAAPSKNAKKQNKLLAASWANIKSKR